MARRRGNEEISPDLQISSPDFFKELTKGTDFVIADTGSMMNNKPKVETPLLVLNCIFGGGIPLGIQEEISGVPASGKSTMAYSMMGEFQRKYPENGVSVIIDLEGSTDDIRLRQLGVDSSRTLRLPAESLESAFQNMFVMFNKLVKIKESGQDIKLFIIFDSLSAGGTQKQHESIANGGTAMTFGGGMMEVPRILKQNIMNVVPFLEKIDASVHYINQVFTQGIGTYAPKTASGGGWGKNHAMHIMLEFGTAKNDVIREGNTDFVVGTFSYLKMTKSKLGPKFSNIPCYVDVRQGGVIDKVKSFYYYIKDSGYVQQGGGWMKLDEIIDFMNERFPNKLNIDQLNSVRGNKRERDLIEMIREDRDLLDFLQIMLIEKICDVYPAHSLTTNDYRQELINNCNYFIDKDVSVRNVSEDEMVEFETISEGNDEIEQEIEEN